jgi:PAS domain S-box-containing protein
MKKSDKSVILLVDDKPANILVLENLLSANDRTLISAGSGDEALKKALSENIDLIILDVQMPGMDGFEVAQILKSKKRTRNIPIIFATAESKERKFIMKGYDEGGIDYLFKPLDPDIVRAKVTVLLKLQLQQKELLEKNMALQNSALLINNSADIIGIINAETFVIEEINQAFTDILGYTKEEARGRSILSFLTAEEAAAIKKRNETADHRLSFETRIGCKDAERKWLHWKIVVSNGKWFFNARDVTEQKLVDEKVRKLNAELQSNLTQLENTNKELESFSYSVSHDLRSPLRALSGYSRIMEQEYAPQLDAEARRLLTNIQSNAQRMGMLIDDLLSFSRLGRKEVQRSNVDMNRMVESALDELNKAIEHHAAITVGQLPEALVDHALFHQVWINLISNAIKYSSKQEKPQIQIGAHPDLAETTYFIKDNGAGFDMHYADKLFGVFQRLHKTTEFEGTGVGLAIVQRIITKHGGRIWANAEKNKGATFYFTLPTV